MAGGETDGFLGGRPKANLETPGCCRSKHTRNCCIAAGVFGIVFLALGVVVLFVAKPYLQSKILASMALVKGSDRYKTWLSPPVQPHLEAYAFHVTNPEAVLQGKKPIVEERGPYVYKAVTLKDTDDNIRWWKDKNGTLTYRPRKVYTYVPELSGNKNPDEDIITVPNIPFWTGLNKIKNLNVGKGSIVETITTNGRKTPFISVSFSGLLWGYEDELPCLKLDIPSGCPVPGMDGDMEEKSFFDDDDDDFGFGAFEDDEEEEEEQKAKEAMPDSVGGGGEVPDELIEPPEDSEWEKLVKPKAEFIDCKCNWGLFRDRNITMRKPLRIFSGMVDLDKKGVMHKYDGKSTLGWWRKDSICDKVKGQDSSTLPPGLDKVRTLDIFISLMCRTVKMQYEQDVNHAGIRSWRFIPPENALGRHDDPNPNMKNPDNECYCLENEGFTCFKSGVMNMEPCKRDSQAPLALSMPHFYQADPSFLEAVGGLKPEKEKHQFYMDVVPEFGFPLAIRPRFQLNLVLFSDPDVPAIKNVQNDLVLPFLWAQDGFDEPSDEMASAIAFGLAAPDKLPRLIAVIFFVIGSALILTCLGYFVWARRRSTTGQKDFPMS